jgi:hypothetical protein
MRRLHHPLALSLLVAVLAAGCSVHSLDYLNTGYTPAPPLPPVGPVNVGPPDAGAARDAPLAPDRASAPADQPPAPPPPVDMAPPRPVDMGGVPDAAPAVAAEVFLIVGADPVSPADGVLERYLRARGLRVTTVQDQVLGTVDTALADLIVISSTISPGNVGARFRDVVKPVVVSDPLLYDDMGMVQSTVNMGVNRGIEPNVTTLTIDTPASPLAARLSGNVAIASRATSVGWGVPNANAIRVASLFGMQARVAVMAYDTGQRMPELVAPARRVGFFLADQSANVLNREGFALLDAAIDWALSR